jgi:hypothetical protein
MKMWIGFAAGFAAGAYTYSKLTEEQRAGVADTLNGLVNRGRSGDIAATVSSGVGNVADAVTERVTDAASAATDAVASKVEGNGGSPTATSTNV